MDREARQTPRFTAFSDTRARLRTALLPGLVCLFLAALYGTTLAPGLTWAFDGADGGDLVTAAATGGVPHPSGYPTYMLIASTFLRLPFGSLAYRTNLLSAVCTVAAALVVYLTVRSFDRSDLSASIASLALGTFPLVWSQAIITEVYALHGLFAALLLRFSLVSSRNWWTDLLRGVVAGVALGNHLSIVLALPLLFVRSPQKPTPEGETGLAPVGSAAFPGSLFHQLLGLFLGLSVYGVIPLRAQAQPPVNWGHAANWPGLVWLASGRMYWGRLLDFGAGYLLTGLRAWSHLVLQQLGILGIVAVFVLLALLFKRSPLYLLTAWLLIVYSAFSILFYSPDSYVYLIPALVALSVWIGMGWRWITERLPPRFAHGRSIVVGCIGALFVGRALLAIPAMNLSADRTAEQYAQSILNTAPKRAIIFTTGDEATFSLWFAQYANGQRPDVAVVASDLLVQPWYHEVLGHTYPDLTVAEMAGVQDILRDNSERPHCHAGKELQATSTCAP